MGAEDARVVDIPLAGMWVTGDLSQSPDGTSPMVKNIVTRPGGEFYVRESYQHYGPAPDGNEPTYLPSGFLSDWPRYSVRGVVYFETDLADENTPSIWVNTQDQVSGLYGWAKLDVPPANRLLAVDSSEYLGVMCVAARRPLGSATPSSIDAVKLVGGALNVPEYVPNILTGGVEMHAECLGVFGRRLVMANIKRQVTNLIGKTHGVEAMYGATASWIETGVTYSHPDDQSYYIVPTGTSGVRIYELPDIAQFTEAQNDFFLTADLFNTDPVNEMPMTVEAYISGPVVARGVTYVVGATIIATASDTNKYIYVCVTAGATDPTTPPSYSPTASADTTDGTAVFRNMGDDIVSSFEILLAPAASASGAWEQVASNVHYQPIAGQAAYLGVRYRFGTAAETTWAQSRVKIGFKDGKSANDPTKRNRGIQIISGTVPGAFVKTDSGYSAIEPDQGDRYWWTEPDSFDLMPLNFGRLSQIPGEITAVCSPIAGRMILYKQNMGVVFQLGSDPVLPFTEERTLVEYGCANQRAWDVFDDTVFTVGTYEVYSFDGSGSPVPLCGAGMRDAVFARGDDYLDPGAHRLGIDREKREVHVYTQRNRVFVYNIDTQQWSTRTTTISGTDAMEVGDLTWAGGQFLTVSSPSGIQVRANENLQIYDTDQVGHNNPIRIEYWLPQLAGGGELMALIEKLHLHYRSSVDCPFVAEVSYDGGATWVTTSRGTLRPALGQRAEYVQIPVWRAGQQPWVRLMRDGLAGRGSFRMVGLKAYIQYMGETIPAFNATVE